MEWLPTASAMVEKLVLPVASSVPVPRVVPLSANVTLPVGTAVPEAGATLAVKVMLVPATALVADTARLVEVATPGVAGLTVTVTVEETLPRREEDPP